MHNPSSDMYMYSFRDLLILPGITFELVRLLSTFIALRVVAVLGSAVCQLTWQRSFGLAASLEPSIQGGIQHDVNYEYESMDSNKDDEKRVPQFSGKLDEYRDYRKRALLYFNGLEDSKQNLAAPRLIANLGGAAFECFRERDPAEFRNTRGVAQLLAVLDERFQFTPEQELSDKLEDLLFRLRRRRGEESTSFVTRFETSLAKVEELITEEQRAERRRQADLQRSEYRRASLDYMVARRQHELTVAGLATGQEPPAEPIAPAPPADLPQLQPFRFPEVVKGFIFLRHIGISLQTRASLLRSSGGSLRYDRVSDLLRRTELDALVASRAQATSHGHGFFADAPEDEDPFEESEGDELEEDYDDDDEYGAFAEGEETELTEEDAVEDEDGDEYSVAMMGYLEARKRLLNLKKARGFKEPVDGHASGKGGHGGTERDRREHRDRDRGRATTPSRRPDFSWRDKEQRRSSQKSYAGRRPRTPPPTRGSGLKGGGKTKTKNKGKGHRASSSSRRGEPAGSQYLGMAISEPKVELDFRPEFSYMAYATAATSTSTSSARPRTSQEFSYVSRQSFSHLESFVEECLTLDRLMGLEPASPESAESCCLVTPPGYAILDTGCTSTLVGDENERLWSAELERKTGGALKPEQGDSDVKFEGINGETRASYRVKYPVRIGPRDGFIQAAVIPGKAPFLLSIQALRAMRAKLDCEHDVLEVPGIGKVPLETNAVGHYLLPLLDFSSGHAFASAEAGLGPDSELVIDEAVSRPGVIVSSPPGLDEAPVKGSATVPAPDQDPDPQVESEAAHVPQYNAVRDRSDGYAIGALVRLAKATRGPWVETSKEMTTLYLILGKHAFNSNRKPWQVKAAQIGYRSKVFRRPPARLERAWVLVMSLVDRCLSVLIDWTKCERCVGRPLPPVGDASSKFLFVYAYPPAEDSESPMPKEVCAPPSVPSALSVAEAFVAACSPSDAARTNVVVECTSEHQQCSESFEVESYFSCDEPVEGLCLLGQAGYHSTSAVCSLQSPHDRGFRECDGEHFPLQPLPIEVQGMQRESCQSCESHWRDPVQPSQGLCSNAHSRAICLLAPRRRGFGAGRRGPRNHRQGRPHHVSVQCETGCHAPQQAGAVEGERPQSFRIFSGDSESEASRAGDQDIEDEWSLDWSHLDRLPCRAPASQGSTACSCCGVELSRAGRSHDCRPGDVGQGVRGNPAEAGCHDEWRKQHRGADHGTGGAGNGVDDTGSPPAAADRHASQSVPSGAHSSGYEPRVNTELPVARSKQHSSVRSRCLRCLGGVAAALTAHVMPESLTPHLGVSTLNDEGVISEWPRVSPEVQVGDIEDTPGLELPQAWKAAQSNFEQLASRAQLRQWLGPQAWKLSRNVKVELVEIFAGRARLSEEFESAGGSAIRLGRAWGQELQGEEARWYVRSLISLVGPRDVYVALPRSHSTIFWSLNLRNRRQILRNRLSSKSHLDMLFDVLEYQSSRGRHFSVEGPKDCPVWSDVRFRKLTCRHYYSSFHHCALGLKHPRTGRPVRKSTTICTTRRRLAEHMRQYQCACAEAHEQVAGVFMGRSVSSWTSESTKQKARALVTGLSLPILPSFGQAVEERVFYESSSPLFEDRFRHQKVLPCGLFAGGVRDSAFPVSPGEPTIFKVTDPEMCKQLNALQYPGRYKRDDLPATVQAQLRIWSGLEVDTVTTARSLKCYVNLPTGVVATRRTTVARVAGEWHYLDHCHELQGTRRLRLPVNCQLIVTFFGDRPAPDAPIAAETQPVIKPVPGVQSVTDQRKVREYLQRLHVGLGHCGRAEFLQHLKDAGAATWLLRQAERFTCPLCEAQRAPDAHAVIGSARPRSFNSVVSIDTLDLTLERDSVQHRVFLLTAVDTATSFARVFHLAAGDSATAVQQLEQGWFLPYGAPEYIYCDPDTIFRSDQFGQCLARHSVVQRLSAAQAPYQHGQIERLHRTLRMQAQKVFLEERSCSPFDAATAVIQARNELMRVEGVSPSVLVFGKLPKAPPGLAEADEDYQLLAERLHREDPLYETLMLRRVAARTAWVQSEVRDRTARISATRPRPYKGPYYKGQVVLVYRRRKGDAANPGHKGVWLGPGEVVAVESTSDKLVPRVIYVTVHGRLFLCSPEQLRPVSVKAEWVRTQLQQSQSLQPTFQDMRMARGTDVRAERPTSAEWEAVHEVPDTHVSVEDLKEEADYEPLPQAPPTPVPGTPVPGTPAPGTPRPSVVAPPLVPLDLPTPAGGEAPADVGSLKRGDKRPHGEHADVELESQHRAELGPGAGSLLEGSPLQPSSSTVLRGDESRGSRARSRTPSRNPPARESSLWAFADFEGDAADHAAEAWYSESKEHDYSGLALGVEFDVDFEELENDESIRHIIKELCFDATAVHKRKAEINERYLTASEKQMFREAKRAEWSQWVANEVVELLSRRGVDPQRVISSRWVLTWKHVGDQPDGEKRAKARLVIRGFKDPDLGQYSTASPTLSRQGRHAILTIAAHHQYRLFTLDAKTAFLAGDRSSRVKPIYAELPRDLVQDQGYDEDTIARIKKVPYGLSEAPLAWYRRLTAELEACGFEQVPADRCIFVLRDKRDRSRVLGIVGAHVDDLLIAGCSAGVDSQFEEALQKLVARLPFGERKYADVAPVLYTGLNLRQHPLTKTITVDQAHYIEKLRETPLKPLKDGLLDKSGQTKFWSQLGALLWVAVNTRPDVAYDISHYASFGTRPEKRHIVALNKIVKTLQSQTCTLTFQKVAQRWEDLALVVFTDAGHTSRPSGHSQAGAMMFWAPREVLKGDVVKSVLADFTSSKIDRAVWSSYASELQGATIAADSSVSLLLLYEQILYGLKAREVKAKLQAKGQPRVLVTDNKGLYDSIQTEKPSTRQGQKMQSLVYQILYDLVVDHGFSTFWVNAEHMLADGLTKLSSSGGRVDLVREVMSTCRIRITYCTTSGRKEKQALQQLHPLEPATRDLESSIDV